MNKKENLHDGTPLAGDVLEKRKVAFTLEEIVELTKDLLQEGKETELREKLSSLYK